jgi:benzoyl-CoA reductase subunit C
MTALGMVPYRILGDRREAPEESERMLSSLVCPFLRSIVHRGIKGDFSFLSGVIGSHTCDIGCVSVYLWKDYVKTPGFTHFIDIPHTDRATAAAFFASQLRLLIRNLEDLTGERCTDEKLHAAIALHNRQRRLVREFYGLRKPSPPLMSASEGMAVLLAVSSVPADEGNSILERAIREAHARALGDAQAPGLPAGRARLMVWGSVLDDSWLYDLVEAAGANVVIDDTCVGTRPFWPDVIAGGDPVAALAERYLGGIRCPRTFREDVRNRMKKDYRADLEARFGYLGEFIDEWKVDGVILQTVMYCDTHGYEIPLVKDYLDGLNIPKVVLDHDYSEGTMAGARTRIEALVEMASGR